MHLAVEEIANESELRFGLTFLEFKRRHIVFKITGLDNLSRQLTDAQRALESLDGELGTVSFNPNDPASVEAAIQSVEAIVGTRLGPFMRNPIIAPLAEKMKAKYRQAIIDRAAKERLKSSARNAE